MTDSSKTPRILLVEMFQEMVVQKNADLIGRYYHPDFVLETNGEKQDFAAFAAGHRRVYATEISYEVRYDDSAWVEADDRVAAHIWIKTQKPGEAPVEFEIVLIAVYIGHQLYRVWETTWPDWRQVKSFKDY